MIPTHPIIAFAIPMILSVGLVGVARSVARLTGFVAVAREDRFHVGTVPMLGGGAVLAAVAAGLLLCRAFLPSIFQTTSFSRLESAYLMGLIGFFALGLIDDRRSLSPWIKGLCQGVILAAVLFIWRPEATILSVSVTPLLWVGAMLLLNAWNYLDHADGVFATAAAIGAVVLAIQYRSIPDPGFLQIVLWSLAGAMVGFLVWNLPPARIFLGDAGALPIGFTLVFASIVLITSGSIDRVPGALAPHAIALADLLLVTIARFAAGKNPFVGGREHTAHRLTGRIGPWNTLAVVLLFVFIVGFGATLLGRRWPLVVTIACPFTSLMAAVGLLNLSPPAPRKAVSKPASRGRGRGSGSARSV